MALLPKLQHLEGLIEALVPPGPPTIQVDITAEELQIELRKVVGNIQILLADTQYKITTKKEMERFLHHVKVYLMKWRAEAPDCDDFTRKLKGELVCRGWWWQPPLDCWFLVNGGHSEFITMLLDEDNKKQIYLIEGQKDFDMFELAVEIFEENKAYLIKQ